MEELIQINNVAAKMARKLTIQELYSIGDKLNMQIVIKAACDNYIDLA